MKRYIPHLMVYCLVPLLLLGNKSQTQSIEKKAQTFLDLFNVRSNITEAAAIQTPIGFHLLGGSGTLRTNVENLRPFHVTLPTVSAGCGGIDYTMGALNVASKEEIVKALKAIGKNAAGYAFLLALDAYTPVVGSTMKTIQSWANQFNSININSCEIGASLVHALTPQNGLMSESVCQRQSDGSALFRDMIDARHKCSQPQQQAQTLRSFKNDKKNPRSLGDRYNLAWEAMAKMPLDDDMKNIFMTITGTIIVDVEKALYAVKEGYYQEGIDLLLWGVECKKGYTIACEGEAAAKVCVNVKENQTLTVLPANAMQPKILGQLQSLMDKVLSERPGTGGAITPDEKELLHTTHFPIGSLISVMATAQGKASLISLHNCATIIATGRVIEGVGTMVHEIYSIVSTFQNVPDTYQTSYAEYLKKLDKLQHYLSAMQATNFGRLQVEYNNIKFLIDTAKMQRAKDMGVE